MKLIMVQEKGPELQAKKKTENSQTKVAVTGMGKEDVSNSFATTEKENQVGGLAGKSCARGGKKGSERGSEKGLRFRGKGGCSLFSSAGGGTETRGSAP